MIRVIFFVTLILNFSLFGWLFLNKKPSSSQSQQRFVEQLEPNSIQIVANAESQSSTGSIQAFANTNNTNNTNNINGANTIQTCVETNLASEQEIEYIQREIRNISLNIKQEILNKSEQGQFLVYQSAKNTEQALKMFRAKNITPLSIMRNGNEVLLGLGTFSTRAEATEHQKKLSAYASNLQVLEQPNIQMNVFWLRFPELSLEQNKQIKDFARKSNLSVRFCGKE